MSDDLKPCPFCGEAQPPHDDTSWVRCLGCGAETGWRPTGDEAIAAWNTRTPDPRIEALTAKLATCEKYRDAYAECDRIGTQAVRDLEVRLAKAHEKEIAVWSENYAAMERKLEAARADAKKAVEALRLIEADCDADYPPSHLAIKYAARATLAEIEGEKT